jgi:hypothetical protein
MPAQLHNLLIEQGARFSRGVLVKVNGSPISLVGCRGQAQMRAKYPDPTPISTFNVAIDVASGQIFWGLTSAQTALLIPTCKAWDVPKKFQTRSFRALPLGCLVWDLELVYPDSEIDRLLYGAVMITPNATT